MVWTWDVRERVTLAAIIQKDIFDHNFQNKAPRMMILAARYVIKVKESDGAICFDLWPWPFKVMTFVKSRFGPYLSY